MTKLLNNISWFKPKHTGKPRPQKAKITNEDKLTREERWKKDKMGWLCAWCGYRWSEMDSDGCPRCDIKKYFEKKHGIKQSTFEHFWNLSKQVISLKRTINELLNCVKCEGKGWHSSYDGELEIDPDGFIDVVCQCRINAEKVVKG